MDSHIAVRFGGELAPDNKISLRTLGKAASHLQSAIDRAVIQEQRKQLAKHARIRQNEYELADFYFEVAPPASFKFLAQSNKPSQFGYVKILLNVLREADQRSREAAKESIGKLAARISLRNQAETKLTHLNVAQQAPRSFLSMASETGAERKFVDKAIMGQINHLLSPLRSEITENAFIEISLYVEGDEYIASFDRESAMALYWYTMEKRLGDPVLYHGVITDLHRVLNSNARSAAFFNIESKKKSRLLFASRATFNSVVNGISQDMPIKFIGCPVHEYGALDPLAGDVYFLRVVD